jgi:hypothetical protein
VTSDYLRAPLRVLPDDSGCVIDCDTCAVRGAACGDCVVSVMLGGPPGAARDAADAPGASGGTDPTTGLARAPGPSGAVDPAGAVGPAPIARAAPTAGAAPTLGAGNVISVDPEARRALAVLAEAGIVPPLRMTPPSTPGPT